MRLVGVGTSPVHTKKNETFFQPSKIDKVHASYIMLYHVIVSHDIPIY